MDSNFSSNPKKRGSYNGPQAERSVLILHNDDINTFEFVMETLEEVCSHSEVQAEQCATIAHYKGKCDILSGDPEELRKIRHELVLRGLRVTVDQ